MIRHWLPGIGIFLLLLASCTLNATQEQAFSNQKAQYINAINDGSALTVVSMTYPELVAHVKQQGTESFKSTFAPESRKSTRLGAQVIQQTVKKGRKIHILFEVEVQNLNAENSKEQFVGISEDNGENWFFMPYSSYRDGAVCKSLQRLIK